MSESSKALVQRFYDLYNLAAWDQMDSLVSSDYVHHSNANTLNLEQFKRGAAAIHTAIADFQIVVEEMIAEADKVAVRWVGHGTHSGPLYGETPTARRVDIYGATVHRVQNDRIAEDWEYVDEHDLMRQLGADRG